MANEKFVVQGKNTPYPKEFENAGSLGKFIAANRETLENYLMIECDHSNDKSIGFEPISLDKWFENNKLEIFVHKFSHAHFYYSLLFWTDMVTVNIHDNFDGTNDYSLGWGSGGKISGYKESSYAAVMAKMFLRAHSTLSKLETDDANKS